MVEQDSRNQESGEHEEQVHATPGQLQDLLEIPREIPGIIDQFTKKVMPKQDKDDCNSSDPVELNYSLHAREFSRAAYDLSRESLENSAG